jgi:hypothetical protein
LANANALLRQLYDQLIGPCADNLVDARPVQPEAARARLLVGVSDAALPHIDGEVAALRNLFDSAVVLAGEAATERAFRRCAPDAEVIHLASHAVFRQDNPLFSTIKLADGWLSLNDLYSMRLRVWLVALSACETGVNDVLAGDELVGLARGFFQAGAGSVVVSLWAVNDASTARLMQRFYGHLESGQTPAAPTTVLAGECRTPSTRPTARETRPWFRNQAGSTSIRTTTSEPSSFCPAEPRRSRATTASVSPLTRAVRPL